MYPKLFLWLITGGGIGSLVMGFLHQFGWLYVPPIAFGTYFFGCTILNDVRRNMMGYGWAGIIFPSMFVTNVGVTVWNTLIQTGLFFVGWAASMLLSLIH